MPSVHPTCAIFPPDQWIANNVNGTIYYSSTNATGCTLTPGNISQGPAGQFTVGPNNNDVNYTVTCDGNGLQTSCTSSMRRQAVANPICAMQVFVNNVLANPANIGENDNLTLNWASANADNCVIQRNFNPVTSGINGSNFSLGTSASDETVREICTMTGNNNPCILYMPIHRVKALMTQGTCFCIGGIAHNVSYTEPDWLPHKLVSPSVTRTSVLMTQVAAAHNRYL